MDGMTVTPGPDLGELLEHIERKTRPAKWVGSLAVALIVGAFCSGVAYAGFAIRLQGLESDHLRFTQEKGELALAVQKLNSTLERYEVQFREMDRRVSRVEDRQR